MRLCTRYATGSGGGWAVRLTSMMGGMDRILVWCQRRESNRLEVFGDYRAGSSA